jgi:serine/threonine protein phosphatase PrpC
MEDAHIIEMNLEGGNMLFAVFDGHGGKLMSVTYEE